MNCTLGQIATGIYMLQYLNGYVSSFRLLNLCQVWPYKYGWMTSKYFLSIHCNE